MFGAMTADGKTIDLQIDLEVTRLNEQRLPSPQISKGSHASFKRFVDLAARCAGRA